MIVSSKLLKAVAVQAVIAIPLAVVANKFFPSDCPAIPQAPAVSEKKVAAPTLTEHERYLAVAELDPKTVKGMTTADFCGYFGLIALKNEMLAEKGKNTLRPAETAEKDAQNVLEQCAVYGEFSFPGDAWTNEYRRQIAPILKAAP